VLAVGSCAGPSEGQRGRERPGGLWRCLPRDGDGFRQRGQGAAGGSRALASISWEAGFADQSHLTSIFRRENGVDSQPVPRRAPLNPTDIRIARRRYRRKDFIKNRTDFLTTSAGPPINLAYDTIVLRDESSCPPGAPDCGCSQACQRGGEPILRADVRWCFPPRAWSNFPRHPGEKPGPILPQLRSLQAVAMLYQPWEARAPTK
jgi:hypothetical protein